MASFDCRPTDATFLDDAPERFVLVVELGCTPAQLFEILEDPGSWPRWAPGITRVEWTSPRPYGVGATRTVGLRGGAEIEEVFDVWQPGKQLVFHVARLTDPVFWSFAERYVVEARDDGRCQLTWTVAYEPRDRFARLHPWVRPAMRVTLVAFTQLLRLYVARRLRSERRVEAQRSPS
jgi:hypothetical protein